MSDPQPGKTKTGRPRFKLGVLDRSLGLPGDPEAVGWAAELLFEGLVVSVDAATTLGDPAVQKRYREGARKHKVALAALALEAREPTGLEALLTTALPIARALGVAVVRVPLPGAGRTEAEREFFTYLLGRVAPAAAQAKLVLALSGSLPVKEMLALVAGLPARTVKLSYDIGAAARARLNPVEEVRWLLAPAQIGRLGEVHLREVSGYLGKGHIDVPGVVAALQQARFDRWVHLATDAPSGDPEADALENQRYLRGLMRAAG